MAEFDHTGLTQQGEAAVMSAILGQSLAFTRIALGDGYMPPGYTADDMEALVHECASVDVMRVDVHPEDTADVCGTYVNDSQVSGFWFRELGLFATDPATDEEILFAYANADDMAEWIPSTDSGTIFEKTIDMFVYVGKAESVSLEMVAGSFATHQDVADAIEAARYVLPPATAVSLGGVKAGSGVSIDETGSISVTVYDHPVQFKGKVDTVDDLPTEGVEEGHFYIVGTAAPFKEYMWNGSSWDPFGIFNSNLNADDFVMKSDVLTDAQFLAAIGIEIEEEEEEDE